LFDGAQINSSTATAGQGADVMLAVERLTIGNGGFIASATLSTGRGGNVTVPEGDTISIFGQGAGGFSQITTESQGPGQGGDINLRARSVELANRGKIEASSTGPANAGNIVINAGNQFLSTNGTVTTEASQASGGSFTLMAGDMVHLVNSKITTSVQGGTETRGGDITIDPQFVILQNSQIIAQAFQGQGGDITITAGTFLADPASLVSASSQLGVSGQVNIQSPVQNFSSSLAPLPKNFSSAAALLAQRCAARAPDGKFSTFVQAGREGVPVEPGGLLPSSLYAAEAEGMATAGELTQSAQEPPHPNPRSPEVNRGLPPGARVGPQVSAGRLGGEPVTLVAWEQGCAP
jgi:large exoprotein involved in heme utilization and adhesion